MGRWPRNSWGSAYLFSLVSRQGGRSTRTGARIRAHQGVADSVDHADRGRGYRKHVYREHRRHEKMVARRISPGASRHVWFGAEPGAGTDKHRKNIAAL